MTVSETRPRHTSRRSVIHCNGYVPLFMLKILGTIKCAQAFFSFFFFFLLTSTNAQTYTITHTHTLTHTNAGTTFMPCDLARHYANGQTCHLPEISLRQSEIERERKRERERERVREGNSAHLPVCESSLSSVSTVHTQGAWNLATVICNVLVWGLFDSEKKKRRERDTWSLRSNVELF